MAVLPAYARPRPVALIVYTEFVILRGGAYGETAFPLSVHPDQAGVLRQPLVVIDGADGVELYARTDEDDPATGRAIFVPALAHGDFNLADAARQAIHRLGIR